ncbi:MAG: YsnF/AvaK domain-containing protein [Pyrinomonadaceae bacterium]
MEKDGFARDDISVVTKGAETKNLIGKLTNEGVPEEEVNQYVAGVGAGKTLVYVKADENKAQRAVAIMERYNAAQSAPAGGRIGQEGEVALPVIEEQLQVGKREVQSGGVRVHSRVTERPVEETVTLREETVHVDRRPVNREVTQADVSALREGTFDVTTTGEEAVVSKQARVVEEVVVGKDVTQREETVRDTVRRTDVDVEQIDTDTTKGRGKGNRS